MVVAKHFRTDQRVWCLIGREGCDYPAAWADERVEWVLDVPADKTLNFADDDICSPSATFSCSTVYHPWRTSSSGPGFCGSSQDGAIPTLRALGQS